MTLYVPEPFAGDESDARRLIEAYPFATLITAAPGGPFVTHLPLLLEDERTLIGHIARANPHWRSFAQRDTVAVFQGPHAFVSRGWYADAAHNVPTWNFVTVHVTGVPEVCDARPAVELLEARFEPKGLPPIAEEKMARLVEGVVAFRMPIARLEVKLKLSQNKTDAEAAGLAGGLRATGDADALKIADWMLRERG